MISPLIFGCISSKSPKSPLPWIGQRAFSSERFQPPCVVPILGVQQSRSSGYRLYIEMGCGSSKNAEQPKGQPIKELKTYTMEDVQKCNKPDESMLIALEGNVYAPFPFICMHPGGGEVRARAQILIKQLPHPSIFVRSNTAMHCCDRSVCHLGLYN